MTVRTPAASSGSRVDASVKRAAPYTSLPAAASDVASGPATQPLTPVTRMRWPVIRSITTSPSPLPPHQSSSVYVSVPVTVVMNGAVHRCVANPLAVELLAELAVAIVPAVRGVVVEEVQLQEPPVGVGDARHVGRGVVEQRQRRRRSDQVGSPRLGRTRPAPTPSRVHALDLGERVPVGQLADVDDEAGVVAVERELDRRAVGRRTGIDHA